MGIKLKRKKDRNYLLTILYRIHKILPISSKRKFKHYLDLEWIFERLSHETSFKYYDESEHPLRLFTKKTILQHIDKDDVVLDLGCKYGEISHFIAEKAKLVIGIDYDKKAIAQANSNYQKENLKFVVDEAINYIEKQNHPFDVLILSHILEHLDDPKTFLKEHTQYFSKIYIELPDFDKNLLNHYRRDVGNKLIFTDPDHISEFDRYELTDLITSCGLEIFQAEYIFGVQKLWCRKKSL